ncbi:hypothetical protein H0I25_11140 [Cellulophaga sp. HaHa_2_95]|uniref:hypothetical protein n=1 Tax=Cellulophaga sp. HaHa_2_95 TaxID=2745558 RepID=UPI001C4E65C9|nr:hypothetical protein [Cellulophaga sp. HaHa_2_95]QXP54641.1 hypothetical protein H0I25_11140 [Cellulophaga sp. HaHa_2_95]
MISRKKGILLMAGFMILVIVVINVIATMSSTDSNGIQREYFKKLDLKVTGIICGVEKQTDSYKFIVTLKNIETNFNDYSKPSALGAYFCITKGSLAVFADHYDGYKIGDSIYIGENKTDLIKCVSKEGKTKFVKTRRNAMLYSISSPNKRMTKLIEIGCE